MPMSKSPTGSKVRTRRGYADGPYGQIHYQAYGQGLPLVLLHQAPMTSAQFDYVYAPLARRGIHAVGIDMPGFGGSDPTTVAPAIADYAQVVAGVLDHLGVARAAVLGHHTGALVAAEAAVQLPDRICAVILNGPLLVGEAEHKEFMAGMHLQERAFAPSEHAGHMAQLFDIRDELARGAISQARLSDYVVQALTGQGEYWWGHHAAFNYDLAARLPMIGQPTLILTNSGDQIHAHAHETRALRADFAWASLEGGGIDIVDEQPEAWADAVSAFVREHGETPGPSASRLPSP